MSMGRSIHSLLPLFVLLLAVPSEAQAPPLAGSPPRIVTTATEEVEIAPDRAVLTFTVETRARTAAGSFCIGDDDRYRRLHQDPLPAGGAIPA